MTLFLAPTRRESLTILLVLMTCVTGTVGAEDAAHELEGYASWYGGKFQGRLTANGEVFDTAMLTAAHKTLPFGTIVEVTHLGNGRTVAVRINDRGPFVEGRVIDLSRAGADALDMVGEGVAAVQLRIVSEPGEPMRTIQIGSFGVRANAEAVVERVAGAEIAAILERRVNTAGNPVFRVVVPEVPSSGLADLLKKLGEIGFAAVLVRSQ